MQTVIISVNIQVPTPSYAASYFSPTATHETDDTLATTPGDVLPLTEDESFPRARDQGKVPSTYHIPFNCSITIKYIIAFDVTVTSIKGNKNVLIKNKHKYLPSAHFKHLIPN